MERMDERKMYVYRLNRNGHKVAWITDYEQYLDEGDSQEEWPFSVGEAQVTLAREGFEQVIVDLHED